MHAAATVPPPTASPPHAAPGEKLLTAEEFARLPDTRGRELVRGRVIELPMPGFVHGEVCAEIAHILKGFAKEHRSGRVLCNDSHVPIRRPGEPDTVRGADVSFFSFDRVPREERPVYLPPTSPELVIEVRSPSDRRGEIDRKVREYLSMNVDVVAVADPNHRTLVVHRGDDPPETLGPDDTFTPGGFLPDFSVRVADLFDV